LSGGQNAIAHTEELFFSYFDGPRSTDDDMITSYRPDMSKLASLTEVMLANNVATMPDLSFTFTDLLMWDVLGLLWNDSEFDYLHPRTASMWRAGSINRRDGIENFVLREQWKYELILDLTKHFQDAGILQVIGTDAALPGLFPGKVAHRELTELVKAGLSNFDALAIGTRNAGDFVRRYINANARFGQILPGYRADLVLVDGNPLDDVRNARRIAGVVINGRYFSETALDGFRDELKQRYDDLRSAANAVATALVGANALSEIRAILTADTTDDELSSLIEAQINAAGYAAAQADDLKRASEILRLNTDLFPNSANAWDSFAEITLYLGDQDAALDLYRQALQVDPDFSNAAEQIEKIRSNRNN
jgi:tetratricopeptide (TPR) repeat protein